MKKIFLLFLVLLCQNNFSQNTDIERLYKISVCGRPQTITFIEYKNGIVEGFLETTLSRKLFIKEKEIVKKKSFDTALVKKIMTDLKNAGIETLKKCDDDEDCASIGFLDSAHLYFTIQIDTVSKEFGFDAIYPASQTNGKLEKIELRRKAQFLVTIIDKEINLEKQFSDLIDSLQSGTYCYFSRNSIICIKHQ
ncbi:MULTISPECIES: hypothetical protein [Flavobacterium]|uniref:hypothetical protein n=1 Tax=Flavobacterium TaxID=237 RepID=UPI0021149464|nr:MULTISPECIES: hypothetical protein [Flavobacterium]UUF16885.1 hypothetical protein NLJ00_12365 [Flavobacterium panici]